MHGPICCKYQGFQYWVCHLQCLRLFDLMFYFKHQISAVPKMEPFQLHVRQITCTLITMLQTKMFKNFI